MRRNIVKGFQYVVTDICKFYMKNDTDKYIYLVLRTSKFSNLNW